MLRFTDNNETIQKEEYRGILVGLTSGGDVSDSMEELAGLAEAAGIEVLGQMVQNLGAPNKATFIGKGKVEELRELCESMEADTVLFNDELSGSQLRNLEEKLSVRVIDRTILILDIFAERAVSGEGKLQVELAQLQYRLPRLTGFGKSLSRLGGGIGTRGPGEKKLETDRRHIMRRVDDIKAELLRVKSSRNAQRARREKSDIPVVALVGYTNSGKSALMNRFLEIADKDDKAVFEKDMLFATLDTHQRSITLSDNHAFVLIDTVGFVSKLPHALVEAFKATLEELKYADLLLHIVDASYAAFEFQVEVTNKVISEIGAGDKEKLFVFNKMDLLMAEAQAAGGGLPETGENESTDDSSAAYCVGMIGLPGQGESVYVSAKTGYGLTELADRIKEKLFSDRIDVKFLIPYDRGDISSYLCEKAKVLSMDHGEDGTLFHVEVPKADYERLKRYEQFGVAETV